MDDRKLLELLPKEARGGADISLTFTDLDGNEKPTFLYKLLAQSIVRAAEAQGETR